MKRSSAWLVAFVAVSLTGCAYTGTARSFEPETLETEPGWLAVRGVPLVRQEMREDCGAAALAMVLAYWRTPISIDDVKAACPPIPDKGIRAGDLREYARKKGLQAFLIHGQIADLETEIGRRRPVVVGLVKPYVSGTFTHYEVVVGIHPEQRLVVTLDPARGWQQNSFDGFLAEWEPAGKPTLVLFRAEPPPEAAGVGSPSSSRQQEW